MVEREASWGLTKLRVDRVHAINVAEALAAVGAGTKQAGACIPCATSCFLLHR